MAPAAGAAVALARSAALVVRDRVLEIAGRGGVATPGGGAGDLPHLDEVGQLPGGPVSRRLAPMAALTCLQPGQADAGEPRAHPRGKRWARTLAWSRVLAGTSARAGTWARARTWACAGAHGFGRRLSRCSLGAPMRDRPPVDPGHGHTPLCRRIAGQGS